ncbi:MAG: hypothetical protein H6727_20100 [Myxococcales bacterium]|nr:hypothetical protein [Myxococcales bacterium]
MNLEIERDPQKDVALAVAKLAESLVSSLAKQWSGLSVGGRFVDRDNAILDPEVLLLSTWRWGRTEPRLFDEALRWCCYSGDEIDVSRLQALLKEEPEKDLHSLAGAFAYIVVHQGKQKRWEKIASLKSIGLDAQTPLFLNKDGTPFPMFGEMDPSFLKYGWVRGSFILRSAPTSGHLANAGTGLRLLLRRLVGMGCKAEVLLALLTQESCTVKEIAGLSGYTERGVLLALDDLEKTGMLDAYVLEGAKRRYPSKRYVLDKVRWWTFLDPHEKGYTWQDALRIYRAVSVLWKTLVSLSQQKASAYKVRSLLTRASKEVQSHLHQAGLHAQISFGSDITLHDAHTLLMGVLG